MVDIVADTWETFTVASYTLRDVKGFPYEIYESQLAKYREQERWFSGTALDDQPESPSERIDLYPLRINPLKSTVYKHAYTLFGETEDDGRPLVQTKLLYTNDTQKEQAAVVEDVLNTIWWENNGRSIMLENGIISQIYGGCIFKANYAPWLENEREIPFVIERINPKGFIGIPMAADYYRLAEAWIVKQISKSEAEIYGYMGDEDSPWWVEHWTTRTYEITLDGKPVSMDFDGKQYPLGGENPYGFIPIIYIPHIRATGYMGDNVFDGLKGIVKEYNLRFADFGDAVNDDAHSYVAMRNIQGSPQTRNVAEGLKVIDLGSNPSFSGSEPEPDMFEIRKQRAGTAMQTLIDELYKQYRRDAFIPAVADGEDEGSQRSGLTLAMRFWALGSHVSMERIFWTVGMDRFQTYIVKMLAILKLGKITDAHTKMRMKHLWAPLLPRDREALVAEWVNRMTNDLGSIEHLLELTGDVEDIEEERERMLQWIEDKAKIEAEFAPQPTFGQPGASGGNKPKPKEGPQVAQARGGES